MNKEWTVLKQCLKTAGALARKHAGKVSYELKGRANLVTRVDVACQNAILKIIATSAGRVIIFPIITIIPQIT